jgi:predicted flap endonuclease-1-like 5' DNA nuclease
MNATLLNVAAFALLGFIVGWALEFALDFLYWRRRSPQIYRSEKSEAETQSVMQSADGSDEEMLRRALAERDEALVQARRQAGSRNDDLAQKQLLVRDLDITVAHLRQQLDERQLELDRMRATAPADDLAAREVEITMLSAQLNSSQSAAADLSRQVGEQVAEVEALRAELASRPQAGQLEALQADFEAKKAELEQTKSMLEARQGETSEIEAYLQERDAEVKRLTELLSEANADLDHLRQRELDRLVIEETEYIHEDDLTDIKGIGDVYAERLREAGFYTFRHLADASEDEFKEELKIPAWRTPNLQSWIDQAQKLAEQKEQEAEE